MFQSNPNPSYDFVVTDIPFVLERRTDPDWTITVGNQSHYILAFAKSGKARYIVDNEQYDVQGGDILFFPQKLKRTAVSNPDEPWHFCSVAFGIAFLDENISAPLFSEWPLVNLSSHTNELAILFTELSLAWTGKKTGYLLKCRSLILDIIHIFINEQMIAARSNPPHFRAIEKVMHMMLENYQTTFTIEDLLSHTELSPSHFRLLFKRVAGQSITKYQNKIKINKAKDFLLSGSCNVTEAARKVGFEDVYYFSRLFKRITGVNPSSFLKKG